MSLKVSVALCGCLLWHVMPWSSGCPCPCLGTVRTPVQRVPKKLRVGVDGCRSEVWGPWCWSPQCTSDLSPRHPEVPAHRRPPCCSHGPSAPCSCRHCGAGLRSCPLGLPHADAHGGSLWPARNSWHPLGLVLLGTSGFPLALLRLAWGGPGMRGLHAWPLPLSPATVPSVSDSPHPRHTPGLRGVSCSLGATVPSSGVT